MAQTPEILMTQMTMVIMTILHLNHPLKIIPSLHSQMPSLVFPMLLGTGLKTQGLCVPKSVSPTPSTAQIQKNSVSSLSNANSTSATGCRPSAQMCGRSALPSPSSRASPLPGSNLTSWMPSLALTPHGPMTTLSLSSSSLPISAPTTLLAMLNTNSTTCR
ncbi:hypothetical protein ID866_10790 [Astraeus odoratus]|nr:hypothetical protein ID866_10790 [Astraeus odoratus]